MRQKENEHRERERNERRARRWSELAQQTQRALNEDDWQGASQAYFGQAALQCLWQKFDHIVPHCRGRSIRGSDKFVITCAPCNYEAGI